MLVALWTERLDFGLVNIYLFKDNFEVCRRPTTGNLKINKLLKFYAQKCLGDCPTSQG